MAGRAGCSNGRIGSIWSGSGGVLMQRSGGGWADFRASSRMTSSAVRCLVVGVPLLLVFACQSLSEPESDECPATIENIPIAGCARIRVRLVGNADQPLTGSRYFISVRGADGKSPNSDGTAELRVLDSGPRMTGGPEVRDVWVHYGSSPTVPDNPFYLDSALVSVRFVPVPGPPPLEEVTVRLPVP